MVSDGRHILRNFRTSRILLPMALGLSAAAWLFFTSFNREAFATVRWSWNSSFWISMAFLATVIRDVAYMVRIRALTDQQLNWSKSFTVIMLWEFASAVVPGMLGGGFLFAIFLLSRENINMGRSITAITLSSFQDGVFLAVMAPLVYFIIGKQRLFSSIDVQSLTPVAFGSGFIYSFWTVYFIILIYKLFVAYALFVNPRLVKWLLIKFFSLPILKRWKYNALETGNQLVIASYGLKNKSRRFWIHSFGGTFVSWTARYTIVNCLLLAFLNVPIDNMLVFGRQVVMGIIILFSPTPGGSGIAEIIFSYFLKEFIPSGLSATLGLLWRLISYYPYLIIGAIILPRWIKRNFIKEGHLQPHI
jgi:glycosyltransferase 2 family protein